jgi:hypothetical protein
VISARDLRLIVGVIPFELVQPMNHEALGVEPLPGIAAIGATPTATRGAELGWLLSGPDVKCRFNV